LEVIIKAKLKTSWSNIKDFSHYFISLKIRLKEYSLENNPKLLLLFKNIYARIFRQDLSLS